MEAIELMRFVVRLSDQRCWEEFVFAVGAELGRLVPSDTAFWVETDLTAGTAAVWNARRGGPDAGLSALMSCSVRHPRVSEDAAATTRVRPRRLSDHDICADVGTAEHRILLREMGAYQLNLPAGPRSGTWILGRADRDFTDDEVADAAWLLPPLRALHAHFCHPIHDVAAAHVASHAATVPLSPREVDILALVAQGLTADSIARRRHISPRTVRKHLEHIYAKLGRHDRLTAVAHAASIGLIHAG